MEKIEKKRKNNDKTCNDYWYKDYVGQSDDWRWLPTNLEKENCLLAIGGTAFFQGVAFKPNFVEKIWWRSRTWKVDVIKRLTKNFCLCDRNCQRRWSVLSLVIVGYHRHQVIGESQDYPITPKNTGQTSWWTTVTCGYLVNKVAVMQIHNAIIYATYEFFDKNGFINLIPIFSGNAAEDSTELLKRTTWNSSLPGQSVSFT